LLLILLFKRIGIPDDKKELVFEPFEQVDNSLTRKAGGTGLGLSICRSIVNLMEGQLWCESEVGVGSHFHFEIPLAVGEEAVPLYGVDFTTVKSTEITSFKTSINFPDLLLTPLCISYLFVCFYVLCLV
jgi:hypothetical protein